MVLIVKIDKMNYMSRILYFLIAGVSLISCKPRIEMDLDQWGDHAFIDNVEIIKLDTDDKVKLQEYYEKEVPLETTGVRNYVISQGNAAIDSLRYTAKVKLKPNEVLQYAAFRIYHKGRLVEPLKASPKAGVISDLSSKSFFYRLYSADGSVHDWEIIIE